jgi:CheY-like chemotaxis protein
MMQNDRMKLLVVDDSVSVIDRLTRALSETLKRTEVIYVSNGEDALKIVQSNSPPSIVLLDLHLPAMSGIEVLKKIKTSNPEITVFIFTNQTSANFRTRCLKAGADGFFDKTKEFELTLAHVRNFE